MKRLLPILLAIVVTVGIGGCSSAYYSEEEVCAMVWSRLNVEAYEAQGVYLDRSSAEALYQGENKWLFTVHGKQCTVEETRAQRALRQRGIKTQPTVPWMPGGPLTLTAIFYEKTGVIEIQRLAQVYGD